MQAPPQLAYGNFACPHCRGEIPKTIPKGMVFPCPYCKVSIESPGSDITAEGAAQYQAWAMQHGSAAAAAADQGYRQQHDPANAVFASTATIKAAIVGGQPAFIGAAVAADGSWSMKMLDASGRQLWESLQGSRWSYPPDEQKMAIRAERLFVAIEGRLHCLDLATGRASWSAALDGNVETHPDIAAQGDELMLYDFPGQPEGAVALLTKQGSVLAWGRDTGRPLWTQRVDRPSVTMMPGVGLIFDDRQTVTLVRAFDGQVLASWQGDELPDSLHVEGQRLAVKLDVETGSFDASRVRIYDTMTLGLLADHFVDAATLEQGAFFGDRIFVPVDNVAGSTFHVVDPAVRPAKVGFFAKLFGAKPFGKRHQHLPVPGMRFVWILRAGSLVLFHLQPLQGGGRRILGLDAATLAQRFDSGPLAEEPSTMDTAQIQANDELFVYVTSPSGDSDHCELRCVDASTGAERYRFEVGDWSSHHIDGQHLVVVHHPPGASRTVSVFSLADGRLLARNPFG